MRNLAKLSACVVTLVIAGCSKVQPTHYYALETAPALSGAANDRQVAATVAVSQFGAPPYLRQGRIVYRQSPEEVGFYEYRRWAVDPTEAITAEMINSLRSRRLFSFVKRYDSHNEQDYLMTGRLERLEEVDYGGPVRVEAQISGELVNLRTGDVDWTGDASATFTIEKNNMDSVVAQMDRAVRNCVDQLTASMKQRVRIDSGKEGDE